MLLRAMALVSVLGCGSSARTSSQPASPQSLASSEAQAMAPVAAPVAAPVGIDVSALPEITISAAPTVEARPSSVSPTRVDGWFTGTFRAARRMPHDRPFGLFASRRVAARYARRGDVAPAESGTCFKAGVAGDSFLAADGEAVLTGDPHGGRHPFAIQATHWLGLGSERQNLSLEITDGWVSNTRSAVEESARQEVQFIRVAELDGIRGPDDTAQFAVFAARQAAVVHLLIVPLDEAGDPILRLPDVPQPSDDDEYALNLFPPCPYQRLVVGTEPVRRGLWLHRREEPALEVRAVSELRDGHLWLEVELGAWSGWE